MIACGFETSGTVGSVAIVDDARGVLAERTFEKGLRHGQAVIPALDQCLAEAKLAKGDVDLFVAGVGPGSYTGLRVGIMTAKALGFALRKPVVGVASFDAIAISLSPDVIEAAATLVVATDARRDRLYVGHYDPRSRARRDLGVRPAARVLEGAAEPVLLAGYALDAYPDLRSRARFVEAHAPARVVARLGFDAYRTQPPGASLHDVKPLYLRAGLAAEE